MLDKMKLENFKKKMDNLIINSIEFEINDEDENNNNNRSNVNNLASSIIYLDNINESLNANLSKSVFDLINCFICLSPVQEPLSCPKCNNFACKKCLEIYFGNQRTKECPLCKGQIKLIEMKENKIIKEIEQILNKEENKKIKFKELKLLIEEKKNEWKNQNDNIKSLIDRIIKYKEDLEYYKNEYINFILNSKILIEKTFEEFKIKIEILENALLSYNKIANDSIQKYNDIYKNSQDNTYNDSNIKNITNEILSLERKHFNESHIETNIFLNNSLQIVPSINLYNIKEKNYTKDSFTQKHIDTIRGIHFKLGSYNLKYIFNDNDIEKYKATCNLCFTLNNNQSKKMCFLISQILIFNNNIVKLIPMKLIKNDGNNYIYECPIDCQELYKLDVKDVVIKTKALIFTV